MNFFCERIKSKHIVFLAMQSLSQLFHCAMVSLTHLFIVHARTWLHFSRTIYENRRLDFTWEPKFDPCGWWKILLRHLSGGEGEFLLLLPRCQRKYNHLENLLTRRFKVFWRLTLSSLNSSWNLLHWSLKHRYYV